MSDVSASSMTYSSGVASTSNSTVGSVVIGVVESVVAVDDASGSAQKIASIYLTVTPYDSYGGGSTINVLVPSGMASYAGGVSLIPRVGESVVVLKSSGSWNYLIGAINGTDHPWMFNPTTASDGSTTTNTPVKEGTGFRVPDLLPTNHDSGSPGSKPGMGNAQLLDENLFFTTGAALWDQGKAKKSHGNSGCSYGFGTVQESLKQAQDLAYESAKGLGFNEVMIRSRSASENTSAASSSTTYDVAEGSMGGVSVYGQDYVDLWSTGTMSAHSKDNMNLSSGKVVRIEAGAMIQFRVGRSGIDISEDGITLSQNSAPGLSSSITLTPCTIEMFGLSTTMNAWFHTMNAPYSRLTLAPFCANMSGMSDASLTSGAYNWFANSTSLLGDAAMLAGDISIASTSVGEPGQIADLGAALAVSQLGIPINLTSIEPYTKNNLPSTNKEPAIVDLVGELCDFMVLEILPMVFMGGLQITGASNIAASASEVEINAGFGQNFLGLKPVASGAIRMQATSTVGMWGANGPIVQAESASTMAVWFAQCLTYGSIGMYFVSQGAAAFAALESVNFLGGVALSEAGAVLFHTTTSSIISPNNQNHGLSEGIASEDAMAMRQMLLTGEVDTTIPDPDPTADTPTAEEAHQTATTEHASATTEHATAQQEHATATDSHDEAISDHETAVTEHGQVEQEVATARDQEQVSDAATYRAGEAHCKAIDVHTAATREHDEALLDANEAPAHAREEAYQRADDTQAEKTRTQSEVDRTKEEVNQTSTNQTAKQKAYNKALDKEENARANIGHTKTEVDRTASQKAAAQSSLASSKENLKNTKATLDRATLRKRGMGWMAKK